MTNEILQTKKTEKTTFLTKLVQEFQENEKRQNEILKEIISLKGQVEVLDELLKTEDKDLE